MITPEEDADYRNFYYIIYRGQTFYFSFQKIETIYFRDEKIHFKSQNKKYEKLLFLND
jgi:hypothetical protein